MRILHFHCFYFYVWNDGNNDDFTDDKKNDNTDNGNDDNKSFDDNDGNDDSKIYCGNDNKSYDAIDDLKSYDDNDDNKKHGNHTEITPRPYIHIHTHEQAYTPKKKITYTTIHSM